MFKQGKGTRKWQIHSHRGGREHFFSAIYYSFTHLLVCLVQRRLIELIIKKERRRWRSDGSETSILPDHEGIDLLATLVYQRPRSCPPNFFCLFCAQETIAFTLLELGLLSIFNQDHPMCVREKESDKSIIGLLRSASEIDAIIITITLLSIRLRKRSS